MKMEADDKSLSGAVLAILQQNGCKSEGEIDLYC